MDKNDFSCAYCKHNMGEGELGYMWKCQLLGHCVPFNWHLCIAEKQGKGKFERKVK